MSNITNRLDFKLSATFSPIPKVVIVFIASFLSLSAQAGEPDFPDWLEGKPNRDIKSDRCGVYQWLFDEADKQTEGRVSGDDLASQRIINIANRLVDHHHANQEKHYSGQVKYLVFGGAGPSHLEFRISSEKLERILNQTCDK